MAWIGEQRTLLCAQVKSKFVRRFNISVGFLRKKDAENEKYEKEEEAFYDSAAAAAVRFVIYDERNLW